MFDCSLLFLAKINKKTTRMTIQAVFQSRDDKIRTCGLFVPNEARYRAALHPEPFCAAKLHIFSIWCAKCFPVFQSIQDEKTPRCSKKIFKPMRISMIPPNMPADFSYFEPNTFPIFTPKTENMKVVTPIIITANQILT